MDFSEFQFAFTAELCITRRVWLFSMVQGHSRWLRGQFCPNQTLETVMRCHRAAFGVMGGACSEVLYGRMMTAVIGKDAAGVGTYNASLVAVLGHYGSAPRACQPYRAKTKGKVERPFRYVRQDFFLGRSFRNLDDLSAHFDGWRTTIAITPVHATTQRVVDEYFAEERPDLVALPADPTIPSWPWSAGSAKRAWSPLAATNTACQTRPGAGTSRSRTMRPRCESSRKGN